MNPLTRIRNAFRAHLAGLETIQASNQALVEEMRSLKRALDSSQRAAQDEKGASSIDELRGLRTLLDSVRNEVFLSRISAHSTQMTEIIGSDGRYSDPKSLARYNQRIYSQVGEDGIIAEIFRRVGRRDGRFLEIGIGDGRENTTRLLLETGWRGTWIEGSPAGAESARELMKPYIIDGRLEVIQAFITAENVNDVLDEASLPEEFDFLSIDIDYNTSHVWRSLNKRPRVACVEYNAMLPPGMSLSVPYDPSRLWDGTLWFGASLKALERIGAAKGLALVGCDLMGVNAFFVVEEEATGEFRDPFDAETHYEPPRFHALAATPRHPPPDEPRSWRVED